MKICGKGEMTNSKLKTPHLEEGTPCFIIAEIGLNHNGRYELAREAIEVAAGIGVNAVKFQNFKTEDFLTDRTILYTYKNRGKEISEPLYDICKRSEFKREWIAPLKGLCDELGIEFISTPTSEEGVKDLVDSGVKFIKNGSDYLTHIPLLRFMGATGLTVILSTGMAYKEEIDEAVSAVSQCGKSQVILLHCTSNYPAKDTDVNLNRMVALRDRYGLPVGFSDHTEGWMAAVQAVTLGARVLEKHFTLDHDLAGPDHWFSSTPDEMETLVQEVRRAEMRMGGREIVPAYGELSIRDEYRLGLVAKRDLKPGEILTYEDVAFRKPARGLLPKHLDEYLGRPLSEPVACGDFLSKDHFKP